MVFNEIMITLFTYAEALKLFKTISLKFLDGPWTVDGLKILTKKLLSAIFNNFFSAFSFVIA